MISLTLGELTAVARVSENAEAPVRFQQDGAPVEGLAGRRMAEFLDLAATRFGGESLSV